MKVTLSPIDNGSPDGWLVELEVEKTTTVGEFKAMLNELPEAPPVTKSSRIIFKSTAGPMYALKDNEQVKKKMLFADTSQPAPSPKSNPTANPPPSQVMAQLLSSPKAALSPSPASPQISASKSPLKEKSPAPASNSPTKRKPLQRSMDLQTSMQEDLNAASFVNFPHFDYMNNSQKDRIVFKMQSCWPKPYHADEISATKAHWYRPLNAVIEILRQQQMQMKQGQPFLVNIVKSAFELSSDVLEMGPSGFPHAHESIFFMADAIFNRFKPVLMRNGFSDNLAGYFDMDRAIQFHINSPEVLEMLGRTWFQLTFGTQADRTAENAMVHNIIYMGIQTPVQQVVTTSQSYLHHLGLPPLERRLRSGPRTIAMAEVLINPIMSLRARRGTTVKNASKRVVWVLGAEDAVEGKLARESYYEDAAAMIQGGEQMNVYLVGESFSGKWPVGRSVTVHAHTWEELYAEKLPEPQLVTMFNVGLGTLDVDIMKTWLPRLVDLLLYPGPRKPAIILTSRCKEEALGEKQLLNYLGAIMSWPSANVNHVRNVYSGMAGNPSIDYDDNGWFIVVSGTTKARADLLKMAEDPAGVCQAIQKMVEDERIKQEQAIAAVSQETTKKTPAVYWGILDLKYNSDGTLASRVKVLETGDGRSSRS